MNTKEFNIARDMWEFIKARNEEKKLGICPFCKKKVDENSFKDDLSRREFEISGLCQKCQDDFFKESE